VTKHRRLRLGSHRDDRATSNLRRTPQLPKPLEIKAYLDQYVIDRQKKKRGFTKKKLAVAVSKPLQAHPDEQAARPLDVKVAKSKHPARWHLQQLGKTWLAQTRARILDVPSPSSTPPAHRSRHFGEDVGELHFRLLHNSDWCPTLPYRNYFI